MPAMTGVEHDRDMAVWPTLRTGLRKRPQWDKQDKWDTRDQQQEDAGGSYTVATHFCRENSEKPPDCQGLSTGYGL